MENQEAKQIHLLEEEIQRLQLENERLREKLSTGKARKTVQVPEAFEAIFETAERNVNAYFESISIEPEQGEIIINNERYVLFKSSSLSYEFLDIIKELYSNRPLDEAIRIGNNFLFDIAHVLGKKDALSFHQRMNLVDPVEKLAAGPVHFAYTGWANVEILPESNPSPDENYFLKFHHHNSFEAQSWKKVGRKSDIPVCTMSCGYSSGWCEESFGLSLTTVELECEAMGADHCTFIMAPPEKIKEYLNANEKGKSTEQFDVPVFFEKKYAEDRLRASLEQKEALLQEVHHRVKNNLQIVSSLLNLQLDSVKDNATKKEIRSGIMRIKTMARIQEMIYSDINLSTLQTDYFFRHLFLSLVQAHNIEFLPIEIEVSIDVDAQLSPDVAISLGLILNEIVGNSFQQLEQAEGTFRLTLTEDEESFQLSVVGLVKNNLWDSPENAFALSLIELLCLQADSQLTIGNSNGYSSYLITIKKTEDKKS
ncbi:MAG: histidine kinase dimerization/phosphoacceptor domain -containing protein [Fluviicola sp.]|nr:histidine kinase dimerization/phosphoacceptor domain -containing protein [Fluviicola sp.]